MDNNQEGYNNSNQQYNQQYNPNVNQVTYGYDPNTGQPVSGYNPNTGQPVNGYNQNMGQAVPGYNQNMGQPVPGYNPNVGRPINSYNQNPMGGTAMPPKKKKKSGVVKGIVIGVLVSILLFFAVCVLVTLRNENASKEVVDNFFKGYNNMDFDAAYDTFHPEIRQIVKAGALTINNVENGSQFFEKYENYLGGFHVDYEITKSKRVSDDELENILSAIRVKYGVDLDISKAYAYMVEERYYGTYNEMEQTETIVIGKDDGKWYVICAETE